MWTYNYVYPSELYHHGVKGQKWGVRRYQNPDGSLTLAGKRKYDKLGLRIDHRSRQADIEIAKRYDKRKFKRDVVNYKFNSAKAKAEHKGNIKKVSKIQRKQDAFNKLYDSNTKSIMLGAKDVKRAKTEYLKMKQKSLSDPSIKKSAGYKAARKMFAEATIYEHYNGTDKLYKDRVQDRLIENYVNKAFAAAGNRKR